MPFGKKTKKPKYIAKVDLDGGKQKLNTLPSPGFFPQPQLHSVIPNSSTSPTRTGAWGWGIGG